MSRKYVVTGAASGIGKATVAQLQKDGHDVIGVGRHDADVVADLSSPEGREAMVSAVAELSSGVLSPLAVIGVRIGPGATALSEIPAPAHSSDGATHRTHRAIARLVVV